MTDASSMDGWKDIAENNTKYMGRVDGQSVFENITLSPSGITVERRFDFMVAFGDLVHWRACLWTSLWFGHLRKYGRRFRR
ncbi:MAG: hypothetical protein ACLTK0_10150 [Anaerovoracaceae bacterium]